MKKYGIKQICLVLCVAILLSVMLCGCWWPWHNEPEPTEEVTLPEETESTEPVETEPPYLMEGYVNIGSLNIRSGPGSNYDLLGQYKKDDIVRIYEIDGKWGKTEIGWIYLGYVSITQEFPAEPEGTTPGGQQGESTDKPSGNINSALLGKWYRYNKAIDDSYFIYVYEFKSNGIFYDPCYCATVDEIRNWQNQSENYFMQSYSYFYEVKGQRILYRMDDGPNYVPPQQTMNFSISGNVLKLGNHTYYRGSYIDALKKIKTEIDGEQVPTEGGQEWPALDPNSPIIGSWYRYKTTGEYCVYTVDFYSSGYCGDGAWVFQDNDPTNKAEQVSGAQYEYTLSGGKVLYREGLYGEHSSEQSYSISGNRLTIGGESYYRGTYQDGIEKLRAELLGNSQSTEPPTEAPTETPTETPTEAPAETDATTE